MAEELRMQYALEGATCVLVQVYGTSERAEEGPQVTLAVLCHRTAERE